jgi:hypothetical protein
MLFKLAKILATHGDVVQEIPRTRSMLSPNIPENHASLALQIHHSVARGGQRVPNRGQSVNWLVDTIAYQTPSEEES